MYKLLLFVTLLSINTVFADELVFKQAGFSIDALDRAPAAEGAQPLQMFLAPVDGFAANVNVQIQPYAESLQDYKKLSDAQFEEFGLKVISSVMKDDVLFFEYSGAMGGRQLYFYAKAVKKDGYVYLATATDLQAQWSKSSKQLKEVVNSLALNQ